MATEVEDLGGVQLRRAVVGVQRTNAYLLTDPRARRQLLLDPGDDPAALFALIAEGLDRATLELVVLTHRHVDHLGALTPVVERTRARVAAGDADVDAIVDTTGVKVRRVLHHGDTVKVGALRLEVIGLRGHTPGSIALALTEHRPARSDRVHLFTGDALFPGGLGATGGDPDRFAELYTDVTVRLFDRFDDETTVRPGHGAPTTIGVERPHLRAWRERGW